MSQEEEEYPDAPTHAMPDDDDEDDGDEVEEEEDVKQENAVKKVVENKKCGYRTCSILAHNKMILHSLKHLNRPIFGLLIGITYRDESSNHTYCHIMDVIPLQHNFFSSMVIEVAFLQIQAWLNRVCKASNTSTKNLRVLGVYFANNHCDDVDKNTSSIIIASQLIKEYGRSSTLLCQIMSDRITMSYKGEDSGLDWYMLKNNGESDNKRDWKDIDDVYLVKTDKPNITRKSNDKQQEFDENKYQNWLINTKQLQVLDIENKKFNELNLKQLLKSKAEDKIYDFDDHLDDQSKDWRNLQLFNM